jgi:hypothetical protein
MVVFDRFLTLCRVFTQSLHLGTPLGAKFHFAGGGVYGRALPYEPNDNPPADTPSMRDRVSFLIACPKPVSFQGRKDDSP